MDLYMITTTDNPYSTITHYDEWLTWDIQHGYHSNDLLARVAYVSDELSDPDRAMAINDAIDIIVEFNLSGMHSKVLAGSIDFLDDVLINKDDSKENKAE